MMKVTATIFAIGFVAMACGGEDATPTPAPTVDPADIGKVTWVMDEFDIPVERCEVHEDGERCRPVKTNADGSTIEGPLWEADCRGLQDTYDESSDDFVAGRLRARECPGWE